LSIHLGLVEKAIKFTVRRHRLQGDEAEEFAAVVRLRLIEDDYAILRKFKGRSSMQTFLFVVIQRMFQDWLIARHGRWRASAEARRLGPIAMRLEKLMGYDRLSFAEAANVLRLDARLNPTERELEDLATRLDIHHRRRFLGEQGLEQAAAPASAPDTAIIAREQASHALSALNQTLAGLVEDELSLIRLRFVDQLSLADIARRRRIDAKALYRQFERLLDRLRAALQAAGISFESVRIWIGRPEVDTSRVPCLERPSRVREPRPVRILHLPGQRGAVCQARVDHLLAQRASIPCEPLDVER
jgi:RNA polymerase sigma factor (sigma-70 family)